MYTQLLVSMNSSIPVRTSAHVCRCGSDRFSRVARRYRSYGTLPPGPAYVHAARLGAGAHAYSVSGPPRLGYTSHHDDAAERELKILLIIVIFLQFLGIHSYRAS
jgi:hypothetical protein